MTLPQPRYFNSFTSHPGGGNPVALVTAREGLSTLQMQGLAREIGAPATCFWSRTEAMAVKARFFSPCSAYQMCGHAVVGLFNLLNIDEPLPGRTIWSLNTLLGNTRVYVESAPQSAPRIMLECPLPRISAPSPRSTAIAGVLNTSHEVVFGGIPAQTTQAHFQQLMVNVPSPDVLAAIEPSFDALTRFCKDTGHDSIVLYALERGPAQNNYHVREFCPLIGVDESAAGGTTNASLSGLLAKEGKLAFQDDEVARCVAYQGVSIGRPSEIHCEVSRADGKLGSVRAGGFAVETIGLS